MLNIKAFIVIMLTFFVMSGWLCVYAGANDDIMMMNLSSQEDLNKLDSYLSGDNVLAFLKAREKLLACSYDELKKVRNRMVGWDSGRKLKSIINELLGKMDSKHVVGVKEDIFINNVPQSLSAPFYGGQTLDSGILDLKPNAERVYKNNLSLKCKKNDLLEKNDMLWINPKHTARENLSGYIEDKFDLSLSMPGRNDKVVRKWGYRIKNDNLEDFFFKSEDLRQWIKHFEESPIFPVVYKDTVILRNEYRVFCLDLMTSNEIWSVGDPDKSGYEYYNTFRHPHENSGGYEFLLSNDMLFTELDHTLIALRLNNILDPAIAWQRGLGEFTLCAKPILNKEVLILTLVNARGEIFICGFNSSDGKLKWNTYIGISSFLSWVCSISCVNNNEVVIGTNYGVIMSVDSVNGSIIWIRKYLPKKYNMLEYWSKSCSKAFTNDKCPIKYDTEFLQAAGQDLYYKPRESDYFYIIDSGTGELKKQVLVDPEKFYILRANQDSLVFLEKSNKAAGKTKLKVVKLSSGGTIYESEINGGYLYGVSYINKELTVFKLGEVIYLLRIAENSIECWDVGSRVNGWLVNAAGRNLFIADGNNLFNYELGAFKSAQNADVKYLKEAQDLLLTSLKEALISGPGDTTRAIELKDRILSLLNQINVSPDKLMPFIIGNIERLKDNSWAYFISALSKKYASEIVSFDGVNLRLDGFLYGAGLTKSHYKDAPINRDISGKRLKREYEINGQLIAPLPITVLKGEKELDFYLIQRFDQTICVNEFGNILWFRRTSWANRAYLYDDVLIIKDDINIMGVDVHSGRYLWSLSINRNKVNKANKADRKLDIRFIGNNIIIILGNKIYSLDILTGYSRKSQRLDNEGILSVAISGETIYLFTSAKTIKIYDKDINYKGEILSDSIESGNLRPEIIFIDGYMVFNVSPQVYVIDLEKKSLSSKFFMGDKGKYFLDAYKNNLLRVIPSKSVSSYRISKGLLVLNWEYNLKIEGGQLWGFGLEEADFRADRELYKLVKEVYYFIFAGKIFFPYRNGVKYYMQALGLAKGKEEWIIHLAGVRGVFDSISNPAKYLPKVNFIITTKRYINPPDNYAEYMEDYIVDIRSKFVSIDINKGKILKVIDLPDSYKFTDYVKSTIVQTKNCCIYGVRGKMIRSELK